MAELKEIVGLTMKSVKKIGDEKIIMTSLDGRIFQLYHEQDVLETVFIESVVGDLSDLVDYPILVAEEVSSEGTPAKYPLSDDSFTWTFYKFATCKGYVDVRWYGYSNGNYCESVDFVEIGKDLCK